MLLRGFLGGSQYTSSVSCAYSADAACIIARTRGCVAFANAPTRLPQLPHRAIDGLSATATVAQRRSSTPELAMPGVHVTQDALGAMQVGARCGRGVGAADRGLALGLGFPATALPAVLHACAFPPLPTCSLPVCRLNRPRRLALPCARPPRRWAAHPSFLLHRFSPLLSPLLTTALTASHHCSHRSPCRPQAAKALDRNRLSHTERLLQSTQDLVKQSESKKGARACGAPLAVCAAPCWAERKRRRRPPSSHLGCAASSSLRLVMPSSPPPLLPPHPPR